MKGYFGQTAAHYHPTPANLEILLPGLLRAIPQAKSGQKALDVGCGKADYFPTLEQQGYTYVGLDVSEDMLSLAKQKYPNLELIQGSATNMQKLFQKKFDLILINMLLLHCETKDEICTILSEAKNLLSPKGSIIIGISHPCFDSYMRGQLFKQFDVSEKFSGYFSSGQKYLVNKHIDSHVITFENFHWTLTDYIDCLRSAGLTLSLIDECKPNHVSKKINEEYNIDRHEYPTYLVLAAKV